MTKTVTWADRNLRSFKRSFSIYICSIGYMVLCIHLFLISSPLSYNIATVRVLRSGVYGWVYMWRWTTSSTITLGSHERVSRVVAGTIVVCHGHLERIQVTNALPLELIVHSKTTSRICWIFHRFLDRIAERLSNRRHRSELSKFSKSLLP